MIHPPRDRIVIATIGSLGDLYPYLALAQGLRARGHHPVIAAPAMYRALVEKDGFEFVALGPEIPIDDEEFYARILHPTKGIEFAFREVYLPAAKTTYEQLRSAVMDGGRAVLLVSTPVVFAAPLLAEQTGVPWVSTVLAPLAFFSAYEPLALPGLAPAVTAGPSFLRPLWGKVVRGIARQVTSRWFGPLDELRRKLSLPQVRDNPIHEGQHSPSLVLAMFSPVLGAPQPDWPGQVCQTGFAFHDQRENPPRPLDPALARFLDEGPPPIVFTLGSTAVNVAGSFYGESVEVARELGQRALLLVGKAERNRAALPDPLPPGVAAFNYAPYDQVFPRAAAIVHQGGVGTTAEALRAGKPMLVVPFNFDQPDNALRMERLGVGKVLPSGRYTRSSASAALRALLSDREIKQRALAAADRLRSECGVTSACEALERLLQASLA